jgi:hypothetical protein
MTTTIDATALFFGAPASLTVDGVEVGATLTPPKVNIEATQYAPEFQGAGGPIADAVFNTKIKATVEFDINEITAAKLAISMPGSTAAVGAGGATASPGNFATTLDAAVAIGDTLLQVTATTVGAVTLAPGMFIKIGTTEFRKVKAISAAAAVEVTEACFVAHDSGDAIVRVDDLDTTTVTWRTGRVPAASFKDVVLDGVGLDGQHLVVTVTDALSDGKLSFEMSDSAVAGSHVVMTGYYDGSDPTLCPVSVAVG